MGVAVSITALPVLAAIVRERGLTRLPACVIATAAAGIMDVAAWLVLAIAVALASPAGGLSWPWLLVLTAGFVVLMLAVVRQGVDWWLARSRSPFASQVPVALTLAMGSAWVAASLGLHPVFGGLIAGFTMRGRNRPPDADVLRYMESAGSVLFPVFLVVSGLTVAIGTLRGESFLVLAVMCVLASLGKLGPGYAAARLSGVDPRGSAVIAAPVNTRGLTELIALSVGLQAGIISTQLYTVLVLMALVTTCMTGPLLALIGPVPHESSARASEPGDVAESGQPGKAPS